MTLLGLRRGLIVATRTLQTHPGGTRANKWMATRPDNEVGST